MRLLIPSFDREGNETSTRKAWLDDFLGDPDLTSDLDTLFGDAR